MRAKAQAEIDDRRGSPREEGAERRLDARQKVILAGIVLFPGEETGRAVTILNRSRSGAKLRIGDVGLIPAQFTLIDQRAAMAHSCAVRWRDLPFIGVRFERSIDLSTTDEKLARQLRSMWEASR